MPNPWSHLLTQTISYKLPTGQTRGDVTYGSLQTAKCRIEPRQAFLRDADGHERAQSGTAITADIDLPLESLVWFPGANTSDDNEAYMPQTRGSAQLPGGATMYVFWFKKTSGR